MVRKIKRLLSSRRRKLAERERELLSASKGNRKIEFKRVFEEHREMVFRVAFSLVGEREAAKDISQEAFIRIYKHLDSFAGRSNLRTWIYRIALNTAINHAKKRSFLPLFDDLLKRTDESVDPSLQLHQKELTEHLSKAISDLPPRQKQAYVLKNREGLSYKEIAEVLETRIGTVKSLLNKAIHNLRKRLLDRRDEYL